jgi:hypothetical protein
MPLVLPQWTDVEDKWNGFLKSCTTRQKTALSFFLFHRNTSRPHEQFDEICAQIVETWNAAQKAFDLVCESIEKDIENITPHKYKLDDGTAHIRFFYLDPALEDRKRFFAELLPIRGKDPLRCAKKLVNGREWRDFNGDYKQWLGKNENGEYNPWWRRVEDLAAFRIVCNFLSDIRLIRQTLRAALRPKGYEFGKKDYIWDLDRARKRGARSLHVLLTVPGSEKRLIELQLMTMLQLAWDQSEHVIEYEVKREKEKEKKKKEDHHTMLFRSLSDLLYIADETFDRIYDYQQKLHPSG